MSTILKALKKLEQEKLERGEGRSEIALDIVKASPRSAHPAALLKVISVAFFILIAALSIYLFSDSRPDVEYQVSQETLPTPPTEKSSAVGLPPTIRPDDGRTQISKSPRIQPQLEKEIENTARGSRLVEKQETVQLRQEKNQSEKTAAELARRWAVSGIAWQENEDGRLAVINGLPVMTGTVIDDATVTAIKEDRVILAYQGENITIFLELPEGN